MTTLSFPETPFGPPLSVDLESCPMRSVARAHWRPDGTCCCPTPSEHVERERQAS